MSTVTPEPTPALALIERSVAGLAAASLELARSPAWNDVLATLDRLASLLGADVGPPAEPVLEGADADEVARFVASWVESLVLPEYLEHAAPGRWRYRVRLPEEACADGLGELVDYLESLALRLDLSVEGDTARLSMSVGGNDRPALAAACAADRLEVDLDLGATRGAVRHIVALAGRLPAARRATEGLDLQELTGVLRFSFAADAGRLRIAASLREPLRVVGRDDDGPLQVEVGPSELLSIAGETRGTLEARVEIGTVQARLPASIVEAGKSGTVEYRLAGAGGELIASRGDRALKLRRLTLGGQPALARRDGKVVAGVEIVTPGAGFDIEPAKPGHFVLSPEGDLALRFGAAGEELTLTAPAGTRLEVMPGRLDVRKGRLLLGGDRATRPLDVGVGKTLVRLQEPRSGEAHPLLRFYEVR